MTCAVCAGTGLLDHPDWNAWEIAIGCERPACRDSAIFRVWESRSLKWWWDRGYTVPPAEFVPCHQCEGIPS